MGRAGKTSSLQRPPVSVLFNLIWQTECQKLENKQNQNLTPLPMPYTAFLVRNLAPPREKSGLCPSHVLTSNSSQEPGECTTVRNIGLDLFNRDVHPCRAALEMTMTISREQMRAFLDAVKTQKLDDDLSSAARHHSAVNVAEADKLIEAQKATSSPKKPRKR